MKVSDVMVKDVAWVNPETSLKYVADLLARRGISGVPVCDGKGAVLGVVSEHDILVKEAEQPERWGPLYAAADSLYERALAKHEARTAGEAMTGPPVTIEPDCTLTEAALRMLEARVSRLPVVAEGRLVGIVTRADLVRAFARTDEEIEEEIVTDVLARAVGLVPGRVVVQVDNGDVTLSGEVEWRSDAPLAERLVARIPGVVSVAAQLTWRRDDLAGDVRGPAAAADAHAPVGH